MDNRKESYKETSATDIKKINRIKRSKSESTHMSSFSFMDRRSRNIMLLKRSQSLPTLYHPSYERFKTYDESNNIESTSTPISTCFFSSSESWESSESRASPEHCTDFLSLSHVFESHDNNIIFPDLNACYGEGLFDQFYFHINSPTLHTADNNKELTVNIIYNDPMKHYYTTDTTTTTTTTARINRCRENSYGYNASQEVLSQFDIVPAYEDELYENDMLLNYETMKISPEEAVSPGSDSNKDESSYDHEEESEERSTTSSSYQSTSENLLDDDSDDSLSSDHTSETFYDEVLKYFIITPLGGLKFRYERRFPKVTSFCDLKMKITFLRARD